MKQSIIRVIFSIISVIVCSLLIICIAISVFLSRSKPAIEDRLSQGLNQKIKIAGIDYFPPNQIILNDVTFFKDFSVKRIDLKFSLASFIATKGNLVTAIKDGWISSSGSLGEKEPWHYNFRAIFVDDALVIKELELNQNDLYLRLWGGLEQNHLKLVGFSMLQKHFRGSSLQNPNIVDISCLAKLNFPEIHIESLRFSYNKLPFSLEGDVLFADSINSDLVLYTQGFKTQLKNLSLDFTKKNQLKVYLEEVNISAKGNDARRLPFKNFNLLLDLGNHNSPLFDFSALIYDGTLDGEGYIQLNQFPSRCGLRAELHGISTDRLSELSPYFASVYGKVYGEIQYRTYPAAKLSGQFAVEDGYLDKIQFFDWIAQNFDLPSLEKVKFDKLETAVLSDMRLLNVQKIKLRSKDVNVDGYFKLEDSGLISSRLSLTLSRDLLKNSSKFQALLKRLKQKVDALVLDFQLSGSLQAMNFKWLDSEFKQKLQNLLPGYMERGIEQEVEKIIQSVGKNQ